MNTFPLNRPLTLDEFVKGYADGGEVESIMPTGEDEYLFEPSAGPEDTFENLAQKYDIPAGNIFVEGFTPPAGFTADEGDPQAAERLMASLSLMDPSALQGLMATSFADPNAAATARYRSDTRAGIGSGGSMYEEGAIEAAKASAADPTKGIWERGFQQLLAEDPEATRAAIEAKSSRDLEALAKVEADYAVMKPLSDLLKANRFKEAFELAKDTGSIDKLMDTNVLRELRPAFSQEEMRDFFAAVPPEWGGKDYDFKPDAGIYESMDPYGTGTLMEAGYPDPTRAFKRKDDPTVKNLVVAAGLAMLTAGIAPVFSSTAKVATSAAKAVAPTVTGAGAVAPTVAGAGAVAPGLAEVVVTAKKAADIAKLAKVASGIGGLTAASKALAAPAQAAPAQPTTAATTPTQPPLEEIVVTGKRAIDPALLRLVPGSLASANLIQGMTDIPTDIYGQVEGQPDLTEGKIEATEAQQPQEPFKDRLDEVIVTGSKYKPGLLDLAKIGTSGLTAAEILKGFTEPTLRPYEELPPEGEAPPEEVVVTGTRLPPIDLMKIGLGGLTAAQLTQGFTQPKVDPLTGEPTEPPKTEQELDKIQDALKTGAPIPGTSNRFLDLLKKYGTVENILKVAGAVSGLGGTKAPPTGGGAGAVYDPRTSAGAGAWIDWEKVKAEADAAGMNLNTYTARNWNKIQNRALEAGAQQAVAPAVPQGYNFPGSDLTVNTQGTPVNFDLLKYLEDYQPEPKAHGGMAEGSKVRGPGHGREDLIPALLSDGEYVVDAETMALLGNGSTDAGAKMMDGFRENIRKHKGAKLAKGGISPDAKSPLQYLRGA